MRPTWNFLLIPTRERRGTSLGSCSSEMSGGTHRAEDVIPMPRPRASGSNYHVALRVPPIDSGTREGSCSGRMRKLNFVRNAS